MARLSADDLRGIWADVKANHKRLDECPGPHEFDFDPNATPLRRKATCRKCGGQLDTTDARWYLKGLEHGRKAAKV